MTRYGEMVNESRTPQNEKARAEQVKNNAGGFVFETGSWKQLDRFLILGQCGPTYYADERKVVKDNADVIRKCIAEDGLRVVKRIVEISDAGRAAKNDPAIFVLAMAAGAKDSATRKAALEALPKVCRIGTHLFHFVADVEGFRKWGRGLRNAVGQWYSERSEHSLALHAIKYQQRDGWSNRDLLRLSHPVAKTPEMNAIFRWMIGGKEALALETKRGGKGGAPISTDSLPVLIQAYDAVQAAEDVKEVANLIEKHRLPREAIPTKWLNEVSVWNALLPHMGITAMIRNLGKMTSLDMFKPMSSMSKLTASVLTSDEAIKGGRVHPMQFLLASGIYRQGHGDKGKLTWTPNHAIVQALDDGFYTAFKTLQPTGKNTLVALDVSGSMRSGLIAGAPGITPNVAAAAMAMVTIRAEQNFHLVAFTAPSGNGYGGRWGGGTPGLTAVDIAKTEQLGSVQRIVEALPMGGTDCSLPMQYATKEKLEVDVFQIYTDNETWHGDVHPFQALKEYRQKSGRKAKLCVVGLTATEFTIADPSDAGMLDVVGMDSHAPSLMADFAREGV